MHYAARDREIAVVLLVQARHMHGAGNATDMGRKHTGMVQVWYRQGAS